MTNRQLYDRVEQLKRQVHQQLELLEEISQELQVVIEENHNLTMENLHLKERLDTIDESVPTDQMSRWNKRKNAVSH